MKMHSSTSEKIAGDKEELLNATYHPPSNSPVATEELNGQDHSRSVKMSRIQHFCFTLLLAVFVFTMVTANAPDQQSLADGKSLQDLLATVEPAALHEVLHKELKDKFQHGVYPEDRAAVEVVHKQDAKAARSLVQLAKRQAGGGSNGTITVTSTSTLQDTSTTITQTTTTPSDTSTPTSFSTSSTISSTSDQSTTSASTSLSDTTSTSETPSKTSPASSPQNSSRPSPSITQSITYTTKMADGGATTITSVTVVNADQAASQGSGPVSGTTTADVGLQTGAAMSHQPELGSCLGIIGLIAAWVF